MTTSDRSKGQSATIRSRSDSTAEDICSLTQLNGILSWEPKSDMKIQFHSNQWRGLIMKLLTRVCAALMGFSALTMATTSAIADAGQAVRTILAEDDRFQVFEIRQKPGEVNVTSTSGPRVIRALSGGSLLRTYPDGKTEKVDWKTGEVQIQGPGPQYTVTNVGDTEVVLYVVRPK